MGSYPLLFVDWESPAPWASPLPSQHVGLEVFIVGEWLTPGDLAREAQVDFLAVVEQRR